MKYWVFGSLNVDLVVDVDRFPDPGETVHGTGFGTYLGGKGGNQAMALARLGAAPHMVGRVGSDQFGDRYRAALTDDGGNTDFLSTDPDEPTGTALIEVASSGDNRIVVVAGANGALLPPLVKPALDSVASGDIVLLQLEVPMETVETVAKAAHAAGATVILDPAPAAPISGELLQVIDWLTPNEHEASVLTGIDTSTEEGLRRASEELISRGVSRVVVKAGSRGAWYQQRGGDHPTLVPGFSVDVVDTTAAGDAFNGGLAWALGSGAALDTGATAGGAAAEGAAAAEIEIIRRASAVAALSVTGKGAQGAMPTADEVAAFRPFKVRS